MSQSHRGRLGTLSARKLVLSAVLVGAGVALAAPGAFATFTSTATGGPQTITTGTVTIALGATGASTNRLNVNASGVAPGDTISRSVDLTNSGSLNLASITLGLSASTSSALDTDATNGLQTTVKSCSVAWTEAGPPYTYTCSGTTTTVLASTAVATLKTTPAAITPLNALTAGGTDHLEVTLTLPSGATNSFQNLSSTVSYNFTGTQRAAQAD
jgi:hypothetical protein